MKFDAVIIGAGPAGSTAALLLARAGWSVAIVEQSAFPRQKVCGEFLSATNWPLLRELGIEREFRDSAGPAVRRVGLICGEASISAPMPVPAPGAIGFGRALGRDALDSLLLRRANLAGARIWQPWRAVALRQDAIWRTVTIETREERRELSAPVIIAAHGSWQRGGLPTQSARPHGAADLLAFKAHFRSGWLPSDLMSLLVFPGGYGGLVHTSGDRLSLSCCLRRDMLQACRRDFAVGSAGQAVLHHLMRNCRELAKALNHAELDGEIHAAGPIHPGVRVDRCDDGLLRLGNAGGEAHPIVAEGISMAMQSAWIACRLLIAMQDEIRTPEAMAALGRLYAQDWRRQFAPRLRAAALFAHVSMRPRLVTGFTPLVARFPQLLTFAARTSGKTHRLRMA